MKPKRNRFSRTAAVLTTLITALFICSCGGGGGSSDPGTAVTPAATVDDIKFTGTTIGDVSIALAWEEVTSSGCANMKFTAMDSTDTVVVEETGESTLTTYSFTGLSAGTEYSIQIEALNSEGTAIVQYKVNLTTLVSGSTAATYATLQTAEELRSLANSTDLSGNYVLMHDISLSDYSDWTPIGSSSNHFTGTFDGGGHTISNLTINSPAENYQGLFGYSEGTITNIAVIGCNISGNQYTGGLAGYSSGTITNSYATGTVTGSGFYTGGLVGMNNLGTITNSYSTGTVTGSAWYTGGLVGVNDSGSIISSYATGSVTGTICTGGLAGYNSTGTVKKSYSTGSVTGNSSTGGIVGVDYYGTVSYSYFNSTVNSGLEAVGGKNGSTLIENYGRSTAEMTDSANKSTYYVNWDFSTVWDMGTLNNGYPYLRDNAPAE